jgi:hypothetical protein
VQLEQLTGAVHANVTEGGGEGGTWPWAQPAAAITASNAKMRFFIILQI